MEVRQLLLQRYVIGRGAGDVAGAARAGAAAVDGVVHRRQHGGMLTHA